MGKHMELIDSKAVCEILGSTKNNLHQLQHRKQLVWVEKKGKQVYYNPAEVEALKAKRS